MMTETFALLDKVLGAVPVVPVTGTVNGVTPVEHVTKRTAPEKDPLQPDGKTKPELTANVTLPVNPLTEVTATVEDPAIVARVVMVGPDSEKSWMVTETLVDLDRVLGAVPVVPVTGTVKGATPVAQVMERTAPLKEPLQPVGNVKPELIAKVTLPEKPLIGATAIVEVPAIVARVVTAGPDSEKSWTGTERLVVLDRVGGAVTMGPGTGTVNGATPVEHVTERIAPENEPLQPDGKVKTEPIVKATVPAKLPTEVTVMVDEPELVARMVVGETVPRETVKLLLPTVTPTAPFTALESVGAEAAVPFTVTTKLAEGRGLQAADIRPALITVAVH